MLYVATVKIKRYGRERTIQLKFDAATDEEAITIANDTIQKRGLKTKGSDVSINVNPVELPYKLVR